MGNPSPLAALLGALRDAALESIFPAFCPVCRADLPGASPGGVCPTCWRELPRNAARTCPLCDLPLPAGPALLDRLPVASVSSALIRVETPLFAPAPFVRDPSAAEPCAACRASPPPFAALRCIGPYSGRLRRILKVFKFHDQPSLARPLGSLLASRFRADAALLPERADRVVCVPQRLWKRRRRGYNPAALLAQRLARELAAPADVRALAKARWTPDQARLHSIEERARNVAGAFRVRRRAAARLRGRRVLLVDDVVTTGATIRACSAALLEAGASEVVVLAAARTPRRGGWQEGRGGRPGLTPPPGNP